MNGEKVPICETAVHLGHTLSTNDHQILVKTGETHFNVSFNMFMSDFGSLQSTVKIKLFGQYCCAFYGAHLWPLWGDSTNGGEKPFGNFGGYHMIHTEILFHL